MPYYIYRNNEQSGPYEDSFVADEIRQGRFSTNDLGCRVGGTVWQPLSSFFPLESRTGGGFPNPPASHQWMRDSANLPADGLNRSRNRHQIEVSSASGPTAATDSPCSCSAGRAPVWRACANQQSSYCCDVAGHSYHVPYVDRTYSMLRLGELDDTNRRRNQ